MKMRKCRDFVAGDCVLLLGFPFSFPFVTDFPNTFIQTMHKSSHPSIQPVSLPHQPPLILLTFSFPPTLPPVTLLTHLLIAHPRAKAWNVATSRSSASLLICSTPLHRRWIVIAAPNNRSRARATTAHSLATRISITRLWASRRESRRR